MCIKFPFFAKRTSVITDTGLDNVRVRFFCYHTLAHMDGRLDMSVTRVTFFFVMYRVILLQHKLTQSFVFETGNIRYVY